MEKIYGRSQILGEKQTSYCPGCPYGNVLKITCDAAEELGLKDSLVVSNGVGCFDNTPAIVKLPTFSGPHGRLAAVATGFKRCQPDTPLLLFQGDGDCAGIGLMETITAANRGENFTVMMFNNLNFAMTGGQMAPTTLVGMKTSTCKQGRDPSDKGYPMRVAEMIATLDAPKLVARVALYDPKHILEFKAILKKALEIQINGGGYSFIEILSSCPTNWHMKPQQAYDHVRDTVTKTFPLGIFKSPEA